MRDFIGAQLFREQTRGGDGILDREIDAHSADRRHGVRGIADAEQSVARPLAQAIDFHR